MTTPSYSLVNEPGDEAICGGSGDTNAYSNGIDRTCLLQGDIGLNLDLASGVSELDVEGAMNSWNSYLHEITSIWTPFTVNGDSLTVQVTPSPYAVTSDQTPITTEGYHTFTSNVGDPGTSRVWAVDDSRTTQIDPDTIFSTSGNIATLWVEAGSYTLRFHVFDDYQDIPVCTDSGDQYIALRPSLGKSSGAQKKAPGPVPNVVEGCLPGQGGGDQ